MRSAKFLLELYHAKADSKLTSHERTMVALGLAKKSDFAVTISFTDTKETFTFEDGALDCYERDVPEAFDL